MAPILVVGAAGFLGSTICRLLVEADVPVRAYTRVAASHPTLDSLQVERHCGDINDAVALRRALKGCGSVVNTVVLGHYSRRYWDALHQVNAQGTLTLLEACVAADVQNVVLLDTISAFPISHEARVRTADFDSPIAHLSRYPYLHSKEEARRIADRFRHVLRIVTLHCSPMYGAGDKHNHTGAIFQALSRHGITAAPPGGTSVVCVEDAARACILAATRLQVPARLVVSSEHHSFLALYDQIASAVRKGSRIWRTVPTWCYYPTYALAALSDHLGSASQFTPYLIRNGFRFRYFDAAETYRVLGWKPVVDIAEAIKMQAAWMRRAGLLPEV